MVSLGIHMIKSCYYHPGSAPTSVSWHLYFKSSLYKFVLLRTVQGSLFNQGDFNAARFDSTENRIPFSSPYIY